MMPSPPGNLHSPSAACADSLSTPMVLAFTGPHFSLVTPRRLAAWSRIVRSWPGVSNMPKARRAFLSGETRTLHSLRREALHPGGGLSSIDVSGIGMNPVAGDTGASGGGGAEKTGRDENAGLILMFSTAMPVG